MSNLKHFSKKAMRQMKCKTGLAIKCCTLLLLVPALGASVSNAVSIRGAGDCGTWIEKQKEEEKGRFNSQQAWLVGYLSGLAVARQINFWGDQSANSLSNESVFLWMDNYCKNNPLMGINDGADALFIERRKMLPKVK